MIAAAPVDTGPFTLGYVLGALLMAATLLLFLLIPVYLESDFHRRGVARRRAYRNRREARVVRHH